MNIYEMYGKECEERIRQVEENLKMIKLLQRLKKGEVKLDDLEVKDNSWYIKPTQEQEQEPEKPKE